jgi:hypothetical protein
MFSHRLTTACWPQPMRSATYALGTDHQIYENAGTWAARTPGLTGWHLAG